MVKIKNIILIVSALFLLIGCSDSKETQVDDTTEEIEREELTQEELNEQLKDEAIEADFIKINGDEVEEGTKLKATGEVSTYVEGAGLAGKDFTLTTEEHDGYGMYDIVNIDTTGFEIEEGMTVTVYGTYYGRSESGIPQILATVIE